MSDSIYSPATEKESTDRLLHDAELESGEDEEIKYKRSSNTDKAPSRRWLVTTISLTATAFVLGLLLGFFAGQSSRLSSAHSLTLFPSIFSSSAPQIPDIGYVQRTFAQDVGFMAIPSGPNASEPVWDTLVPEGLGYFTDSVLAQNVSLPTAIHQLHCLYIVRRAFYSGGPDGDLVASDLGKSRAVHVPHCFDYLQQTITCAADGTIEPGIETVNKDASVRFTRTCRDWEQIKGWLASHRAFDAHGFLAYTDEHEHQHS